MFILWLEFCTGCRVCVCMSLCVCTEYTQRFDYFRFQWNRRKKATLCEISIYHENGRERANSRLTQIRIFIISEQKCTLQFDIKMTNNEQTIRKICEHFCNDSSIPILVLFDCHADNVVIELKMIKIFFFF